MLWMLIYCIVVGADLINFRHPILHFQVPRFFFLWNQLMDRNEATNEVTV